MLQGAAFTALAIAATTSVPVARRRREHLPVAVFLWAVLLCGIARQEIIVRIVRPAKEAAVTAGLNPLATTYPDCVIWASHAEHAIFLGTLVGAGALASAIFFRKQGPGAPRRSVIAYGIGWLAFVASMILSFPRIRGHHVELAFYLPASAGSVVGALASLLSWKQRRLSVQPEHVAAVLLAAVDALIAVKFFVRSGVFSDLEVGGSLVVYSVIALTQGVWLWWTSSRS